VRFTVTDREALPPVRLGIEIASALRTLYPADWDRTKLDVLLLSRDTVGLLERGARAPDIGASWRAGLDSFRRRRSGHLLYSESP
jgi:hypothetical protein